MGLANGTYSTAFAIAVPPARNDLTPDIQLRYESNTQHGELGIGWAIPTTSVRRSLRFGVPRYMGPTTNPADDDLFEYTLGGHQGELKYIGQDRGYLLFRAKREGPFADFLFDVNANKWIVQEQSGLTHYLGEQDANYQPSPGKTFAWYVKRVLDPFGDLMRYSYDATHGNVIRPHRIEYDLTVGFTPYQIPHVDFTYTTSAARRISYATGFRAELDAALLTTITVHGYGKYDPSGAAHSRQIDVAYSPVLAGGYGNISSMTPQAMPAVAFEYVPPVTALPTSRHLPPATATDTMEQRNLEITRRMLGPHLNPLSGHSFDYLKTSQLADVDGDGHLDLVIVDSRRLPVFQLGVPGL